MRRARSYGNACVFVHFRCEGVKIRVRYVDGFGGNVSDVMQENVQFSLFCHCVAY